MHDDILPLQYLAQDIFVPHIGPIQSDIGRDISR
jgi:hypothetical protein